jgi:hypothetical protein
MALCEGNHCANGNDGTDPGNGRIILLSYESDNAGCSWQKIKTIHIPYTANFQDYSDLAIHNNKIALVSQKDSALFIGRFDFNLLEFVGSGNVYNFPRDHGCNIQYCNVEGISWIDDTRFLIVSDKAKKDNDYYCMDKDQSISMFALPALE